MLEGDLWENWSLCCLYREINSPWEIRKNGFCRLVERLRMKSLRKSRFVEIEWGMGENEGN
jgi:hypothetical protein